MNEGVADFLVKVMKEYYGDSRVNACFVLVLLSKKQENRGFMMNVVDLPQIIAEVISGKLHVPMHHILMMMIPIIMSMMIIIVIQMIQDHHLTCENKTIIY